MAIHVPGKRDRKNKGVGTGSRPVVTSLGLTSMVDMFTILVVFLLMNYSSTGEIIYIPKDVKLPQASQTKELKPSHIVTVTTDQLLLDQVAVANIADVKSQKDWMIAKLRDTLVAALKVDDAKIAADQKLRGALPGAPQAQQPPGDPDKNPRKITVQADRDLDFLTVKKVMYTVTEAGAQEINFAVMKKDENATTTAAQ